MVTPEATDEERITRTKEQGAIYRDVIAEVGKLLSVEGLAELIAIFSIGRDSEPAEELNELVAHWRRELATSLSFDREIAHFLEKTNFLACVREGLRITLSHANVELAVAGNAVVFENAQNDATYSVMVGAKVTL